MNNTLHDIYGFTSLEQVSERLAKGGLNVYVSEVSTELTYGFQSGIEMNLKLMCIPVTEDAAEIKPLDDGCNFENAMEVVDK